MTAYERRSYPGGAVATTITADCLIGATSFTLSDSSGWVGANPITAMLDYDTSAAEKVYGTVSGTVFTITQRGYDGTSEVDHKAGAKVRVVWDGTDADEANNLVHQTLGAVAAKGDLLVGASANMLKRLGVGAAHAPLRVNGTGDDLEFRSGAWTTCTPTIGGTGWALGNGTIVGAYRYLDDKTLAVRVSLSLGTTSTIGTGGLTIGLPASVTSVAAQGFKLVANVYNGTDAYGGWGQVAAGSTSMQVQVVDGSTPGKIVALTSSWVGAMTTSGTVMVNGIVEIQ